MGTLSKELHNHLIKIISAYFSNPKKQLSTALTKSMEIWNKKVIEKRELKQEFNNSDFTLQNIFGRNLVKKKNIIFTLELLVQCNPGIWVIYFYSYKTNHLYILNDTYESMVNFE